MADTDKLANATSLFGVEIVVSEHVPPGSAFLVQKTAEIDAMINALSEKMLRQAEDAAEFSMIGLAQQMDRAEAKKQVERLRARFNREVQPTCGEGLFLWLLRESRRFGVLSQKTLNYLHHGGVSREAAAQWMFRVLDGRFQLGPGWEGAALRADHRKELGDDHQHVQPKPGAEIACERYILGRAGDWQMLSSTSDAVGASDVVFRAYVESTTRSWPEGASHRLASSRLVYDDPAGLAVAGEIYDKETIEAARAHAARGIEQALFALENG